MHPSSLSINDFDYDLPQERIAIFPLDERDASKLLQYKEGAITHYRYRELPKILEPGSLLLFNNTRVIEARLLFKKATGGVIEIFCLEPEEESLMEVALRKQSPVVWRCLVGGASKWKKGQVPEKTITNADGQPITVHAHYVGQSEGSFLIRFEWVPEEICFAEILHAAGAIPLPPYLHRAPELSDAERYQTVYAEQPGSVAAPTAGLHFTNKLLENLRDNDIQTGELTLHVGAGTFMPVKSDTLDGHQMHTELVEVHKSVLEKLIAQKHPIIPVGTTSLRSIESLYWLGVSIIKGKLPPGIPELQQWEPYEEITDISKETSLKAILQHLEETGQDSFKFRTKLLIAPGYRVRIADAILTNFHQPKSTLLLLVAAMIGDDWKKVYSTALSNDYRFLSYGDGCLLWLRKGSG